MSRLPTSPNHRHWPSIVACLALLALPAVAQAAIDEYPIDRLLEGFNGVLGTWSDAVKTVADRLFWSLALISLTWTMCMMLFKRADFGELFAELVRFIIFTGLFWWMLDSGGGADGLIASILESGRLMGADGSAGDGGLRPSALLESGFHVFNEVAAKSADQEWKDADKIVGLMLASSIVALVALAAVSMMLIIVMTWILAYAGLFLLGFGGARWTSGVAINYYKHVLAVAMSYFVMLLLAGVAEKFLKEYSDAVAADITLPHLAIMLTAAIVLVALLVRIPALVSSMVLGSRFGGAGGASFSGHVMAMGGTAIATGVGNASTGAQALYSAYNAPSAAPPPAPMISMPTIQMPSAPSTPGAASAPMPTPAISVHHLDGNGINPAQVTLSTQNMYPPPAGTAQSSAFGATPSAHEVAKSQVQAAGGSAGTAGGSTVTPTPTPTPTPVMGAGGSDATADKGGMPPALATATAAAVTADAALDARRTPPADAETVRHPHTPEQLVPGATLAASTASLPVSPLPGQPGADNGADDVSTDGAATQSRPPGPSEPGFSSFASQPLSSPTLLPDDDGDDDRAPTDAGVRQRRHGVEPSAAGAPSTASGAGGFASRPLSGPASPSAAGSDARAREEHRPGRQTGSIPGSGAPSPSAPAGTPSAARDGRDAANAAASTRAPANTGSAPRAPSSGTEHTAAASPLSGARVIPTADRVSSTEAVQDRVAAPSSQGAAAAPPQGPRKRRWFEWILRALRRRPGRGDDNAG